MTGEPLLETKTNMEEDINKINKLAIKGTITIGLNQSNKLVIKGTITVGQSIKWPSKERLL